MMVGSNSESRVLLVPLNVREVLILKLILLIKFKFDICVWQLFIVRIGANEMKWHKMALIIRQFSFFLQEFC